MINPAELVYKIYEMENEPREHSESHYPSGLCAIKGKQFIGKCRRSTFYSMKGFEVSNPIEGVALFKMDMGNMIHDRLNDKLCTAIGSILGKELIFEREKVVKWKEKGLTMPFSGKVDALFHMDIDIGGEWKSTYGRGVTDIKNNGPKEDAVLQVLSYLRSPLKLKYYLLSYLARDSGYIFSYLFEKVGREIEVTWLNSGAKSKVEIKWSHIVAGLKTVEEALAYDYPPKRDYSKTSGWRCRYCSYMDLCWEDE
jgi:CRISPR/Cas system-associated exonuclease Cas4 (RecB family)